jgi:hypothetical protein
MELQTFETIYNCNQEHFIEGKITTNATGTKATKITKAVHLKRPPLAEHQEGRAKIGLYPFVDRFNVQWGAIDIDTYPVNHEEIAKKLEKAKVDYSWITKSTSGGCHIYFRYDEPVIAMLVRHELEAIAKKIGYGKSEIFPKQDQFQPEEKTEKPGSWTGMGNAIYLPYGKDNSCVMSKDGKTELTLEQFIEIAPTRYLDFSNKFSTIPNKTTTASPKPKPEQRTSEKLNEREILQNGPPCLNRLNTSGIVEGGRNEALFNFAVMLKKANGEATFDQLKPFNDACQPPLSDTALRTIMGSVNSGEYKYRCKEEPLASFCNAAECAQRKFGIDTTGPDLERFPWVYAKNDNWFVHNESGQIIEPNHFSNVCSAEQYWNDANDKPHNKTSYLFSSETDKVHKVGYHPARPDRYKRNGLNHINVYRPSLLEPTPGDIQPWLDVIAYMIEDPYHNHLFHSWIHSVITNPGQFITWSPLVISPQGLGKDLIGRGISACVGIHNAFIMDMKLIMQQHTGHLLHKCFGIMSETKEYGTSDRGKAMEVIKPLITDLDLKIRAMHKDAYWVENVINCMFYSNHENCITLDLDARRFFVLMTEKPRQERDFYAPCWKLVNDNPGIILDYYLNKFKPHKDFFAGGDAPETEHKKKLVHNTDNPDFIALDAFAEQGMYPFNLETPYINIAHLAWGFNQQRAGAKYNYGTIEYWLRWRAKQGRAEQHADIDIHKERIRIWTLDPKNYRETDRQKLRDQYWEPSDYGTHKLWNQDTERNCATCGRPHTRESMKRKHSPF